MLLFYYINMIIFDKYIIPYIYIYMMDSIELLPRERERSYSEEPILNNDNNIIITTNTGTETDTYLLYKNRITTYTEYILKFILHICIHITLLSILEPLLFFEYIVKIEKSMFFSQLKHFMNNIDSTISKDSTEIRSEDFYTLFIEYLKYYNINVDNYLFELRTEAENDSLLITENNNNLEKKSFTFFFIMLSVTITYYIAFQCYYKRKLFFFKILMKHIGLMIFIGLYELWFFQNIILNYKAWAGSEITYFLMQCLFTHIYKYYPELLITLKNETVTC